MHLDLYVSYHYWSHHYWCSSTHSFTHSIIVVVVVIVAHHATNVPGGFQSFEVSKCQVSGFKRLKSLSHANG